MIEPHPTIRPEPGILDIAPYRGGESRLDGHAHVLKLSSNESPAGPSPRAIEACRAAASDLHRYPDGGHARLREAIGAAHGLDPATILCGAGSGEIISLLAQIYAGPGEEVIHTEHGFSMYHIYALAAGAAPVAVAERERHTDVDGILAACGPRTRMVFVANPNNPTGTMIPETDLARLADGLPDRALLVLDGAYAEYVEGFDGHAGLVGARDNVVMTRTFSKIHGLAALRVGWACAPMHVVDAFNRVRGPFNLSAAAQRAAAAAVSDGAHVALCRAENARNRAVLAEGLAAAGVAADPSQANFVLARFDDRATAEACDRHLRGLGIIVRNVAGYGLPNCLRISVGTAEDCARVIAGVAEFMDARG